MTAFWKFNRLILSKILIMLFAVKYFKPIAILVLLIISFSVVAQEEIPIKNTTSNKGKLYAFWGWNEGWYSDSDIRFTGENYDFTLKDVKAHDKQTAFGFDTYFNPSTITIPQTNLRVGYFISDKYDISIGVDHMKYVMASIQTVKIDGQINDGSEFSGIFTNDDFLINQKFLQFEHTDGLNYLNVEITRNDDLLALLNWKSFSDNVQINTLIGFGGGPLMPKSNVTLWNKKRHDEFHFAGYGFAGKVGVNLTLYKYFFVRAEFKGGFIDMFDIRTSPNPKDRADQHFFFSEFVTALGFSYPLF